jgi:hypothetical protein
VKISHIRGTVKALAAVLLMSFCYIFVSAISLPSFETVENEYKDTVSEIDKVKSGKCKRVITFAEFLSTDELSRCIYEMIPVVSKIDKYNDMAGKIFNSSSIFRKIRYSKKEMNIINIEYRRISLAEELSHIQETSVK